jgi:hypothetical protein
MMSDILNELPPGTAIAYLDDILIPSQTIDEGFAKLEMVLQLLQKYTLTLQPSKCKFFLPEIKYLGREISAAGVRPDRYKVDAITQLKTPTTKKELRQFLGLSNYFRKFISNYAFIVQPLTKLLRKKSVWTWGDDQEEAFDLVKSTLSASPLLKIFDSKLPTQLHCDASSLGVAGILLQQHHGKWHPVAYFSKQCSSEQSRYHSYELETMALVFSLRHFRVYLLGIHFTVLTDCAAIRATASK